MGAWVEIPYTILIKRKVTSLPSWERGLKWQEQNKIHQYDRSLPSWERGLKYQYDRISATYKHVAPLVGAWVEIHKL